MKQTGLIDPKKTAADAMRVGLLGFGPVKLPSEAGLAKIAPTPKAPPPVAPPVAPTKRTRYVIHRKKLPFIPVTARGKRLYIISPA